MWADGLCRGSVGHFCRCLSGVQRILASRNSDMDMLSSDLMTFQPFNSIQAGVGGRTGFWQQNPYLRHLYQGY